jgi:hypothetical protein
MKRLKAASQVPNRKQSKARSERPGFLFFILFVVSGRTRFRGRRALAPADPESRSNQIE